MFRLTIEDTIRQILETELKGKDYTYLSNHALIFTFTCHLGHYQDSKVIERQKKVQFLLHASSNYINEFLNVDEMGWEHIRSHDSCWMDSIRDRLGKIYFDMAEEIITESGVEGLRPCDLSDHSSFDIFSKIVWREVLVEQDKTDKNHYRKTVKFI
jgi:hypothetical protein